MVFIFPASRTFGGSKVNSQIDSNKIMNLLESIHRIQLAHKKAVFSKKYSIIFKHQKYLHIIFFWGGGGE